MDNIDDDLEEVRSSVLNAYSDEEEEAVMNYDKSNIYQFLCVNLL